MNYQNPRIAHTSQLLVERFTTLEVKADILKSIELKALYDELPTLDPAQRGDFGKELNQLKQELQTMLAAHVDHATVLPPLDVTAPFDINTSDQGRPVLFPTTQGTQHPMTTEIDVVVDIYNRMGFTAVESRQIDDDYHMFSSLNFPEGHPARDDYDTFMTIDGLIAPAHTSTMQNRILRAGAAGLSEGTPIAAVMPGRVFRNEDVDARHDHTFHQLEGVYVDKGVHAGHLIATLKAFLKSYYARDIEVKTQPFYFPFTEPSFEFAASCPFCNKKGCNICSQSGWIELGGCGMIHPNVLREAGIDPVTYSGFAWGFGVERMVMIKYGIEDVRHFNSGKLDFLRQF